MEDSCGYERCCSIHSHSALSSFESTLVAPSVQVYMLAVKNRIIIVAGVLLVGTGTAVADVTTMSNPVAPPFLNTNGTPADGSGLCMASVFSIDPDGDFGSINETNYIGTMNTFMETNVMNRNERVIRTVFDLSNNHTGMGTQDSYGDFIDSDPFCSQGGCGFDFNMPNEAFGLRVRGFLNVTDDWVNRDVHFGFYVDDTVSISLFDKDGIIHPVFIVPPSIFVSTWRFSDTVRFEEPGIYPIEILHFQGEEHAALEMSFFIGTISDYPLQGASVPPANPLSNSGFELFPETMFFQTLSGVPSFPDDIEECQQCDRQFVNLPGNKECDGGYYCNEAALCAPCDSAFLCGPTCSPCGGANQFCHNPMGGEDYQCVECIEDEHCPGDLSCNPETNECSECIDDGDCPRGDACIDGECTPCGTSDSCAGNSCNCCPVGAGGAQLDCAPLEADGPPVCMECIRDSDCSQGVCNVETGRCVESEASCGTCPPEFPYCLPGTLGAACAECRFDTDCEEEGNFCLSGECRPCVTDRRCGTRCESCGGAEPYCRGQTPDQSICVQCDDDSHCPGGTCNTTTSRCEPACSVTCDGATPFCVDGDRCVECYADSHCPCNGSCDLSSNTCNSACVTNRDCMGNEHCAWNDDFDEKECKLGPNVGQSPCSPLTGCISPLACEVAVGNRPADSLGGLALAMLGFLGLLAVRRRRSHRHGGNRS